MRQPLPPRLLEVPCAGQAAPGLALPGVAQDMIATVSNATGWQRTMIVHVLLIDDNSNNLRLMAYLLGACGYSVRVARNGAEGLEMARRATPDLIICDLLLPGLDGYEVARQLAAQPVLSGVPRLVVTARAMADDRRKVLESGFGGCISTPIDPESFVRDVTVVRSGFPAVPTVYHGAIAAATLVG